MIDDIVKIESIKILSEKDGVFEVETTLSCPLWKGPLVGVSHVSEELYTDSMISQENFLRSIVLETAQVNGMLGEHLEQILPE